MKNEIFDVEMLRRTVYPAVFYRAWTYGGTGTAAHFKGTEGARCNEPERIV